MCCCAGPAVQFADPGAAFGLVQLGKQLSQTVTIQNTSQHSSAAWTLCVLPLNASSAGVPSSNTAAQQAQHASSQANSALSRSGSPDSSTSAQHAQQAAIDSNADAQQAQQDALDPTASAQQAAADSSAGAQHAQQAAYQGLPAALQAKEQQLLQQLHDAHVADPQSTLTEADDSSSTSAAEAPTLALNPFEGIPADEAEEEHGCRVTVEPEFGTLAAGASATVQVTQCTLADNAGMLSGMFQRNLNSHRPSLCR